MKYKEISQLGGTRKSFLLVVKMGRIRVYWYSDENNSLENKQLMMKKRGELLEYYFE